MLISAKDRILNTNNFIHLQMDNGYEFYLNGLLFMKDTKAGKASLAKISDQYRSTGKIPFEKLYGAFSCVIIHPNKDMIMFSDNSNMHCFYYSDNAISSSFIELIEYISDKTSTRLEFNDESICEFYTLGNVYFGKTFFKGLNATDSSKYISIHDNEISICEKGIEDISGKTTINNPLDFMKEIAYSISDDDVCLGLTGGYDSRMLFAGINKYAKLNPTISGNNENAKDITIAKKIAQITNNELNFVKTDRPTIDDNSIIRQFIESDGMLNYISDARYRWTTFRKELKRQGYRYHLSGDGGVLHKDWEWMQDIPFYNLKNTNIKRYYRQRIASQYKDNNLGSRLVRIARNQEKNFIERLEYFKKETNTQSYDFLYNYVHGNRIYSYNICDENFSSYAPLQELNWVRYSYHLPRKERFFVNHMRKTITEANPKMANLKTSHGTTASKQKMFIVSDAFVQLRNYFMKGLRLAGRKIFKKTFFIEKIVTWSIHDEIKKLKISDDALQYCIEASFIDSQTRLDNLTKQQLGSIIHIYLLACKAKLVKWN